MVSVQKKTFLTGESSHRAIILFKKLKLKVKFNFLQHLSWNNLQALLAGEKGKAAGATDALEPTNAFK